MREVTDELITAWLDGEVTPAQRADIETAIAASPPLGMRVARLSRADRLLASAFDQTLRMPVPDRFERLLAGGRSAPSPSPWRAMVSRLLSPQPLALAAASLVVGFVVGVFGLPGAGAGIETGPDGRMVANAAMAVSLASVASGPGTGVLNVRLSTVDDDGRYCRQFQMAGSEGLACLENGRWAIDTLVTSGVSAPGGAYVMADGAADPAIVAALQRLGAQRVLDRTEEARAIANGWRRTPDTGQ